MLKVRRSRLYTLWFSWYSRRQFRRYFNSVQVFIEPGVQEMDLCTPVIFYVNHAYWWDGFWSQLCTEEFFRQNLHIIIEYRQLSKHRFFTRLGAFSIDRSRPRTIPATLDYAAGLLLAESSRQNALWIFPQGSIEPVDRKPIVFLKGTASVVERVLEKISGIYLVSVVSRIEYLNEQKPDLFLSFRKPQLIVPEDYPGPAALTSAMRQTTEDHLEELRLKIMEGMTADARVVVRGTASINKRLESIRCFPGLHKE
jgi:chlorobactene lauroyltransferase